MPASLIIAPATEPVTLDELKAHLRYESAAEDSLMTRLIATARAHVEAATRRVMITQAWRAYLDRWPAKRKVLLPIAPIAEISEVRVFNDAGEASIIMPTSYSLDAARTPNTLILQAAILAPTAYANGIEIDMACGYGNASDVPTPLREAVLRLAVQWFEQRVETGRLTLSLPSSVIEALMSPYRVIWP
jgi:uncharacterized phiE125 gp8 family phage protein